MHGTHVLLGFFPIGASLLTTAYDGCGMAKCHNARPWLAARHDNDILTMVTMMAHDHYDNEDVTVVTGPTPYHAESGAVRLAA